MSVTILHKILPLVGDFVDPKDAHSGHAGEAELMKYILCGAENGERRQGECLALEDVSTTPSFLSDFFATLENKPNAK